MIYESESLFEDNIINNSSYDTVNHIDCFNARKVIMSEPEIVAVLDNGYVLNQKELFSNSYQNDNIFPIDMATIASIYKIINQTDT